MKTTLPKANNVNKGLKSEEKNPGFEQSG